MILRISADPGRGWNCCYAAQAGVEQDCRAKRGYRQKCSANQSDRRTVIFPTHPFEFVLMNLTGICALVRRHVPRHVLRTIAGMPFWRDVNVVALFADQTRTVYAAKSLGDIADDP